MLIGYARTSTVDQVAGQEAQEVALAATGCTKLLCERASSDGQHNKHEVLPPKAQRLTALVYLCNPWLIRQIA